MNLLLGDIEQKKYTSLSGTKRHLMAEGGAKSFFRGFGMRVGLIATAFFLVNNFKTALVPVLFPSNPAPGSSNERA